MKILKEHFSEGDISLTVASYNTRAIKFYGKNGLTQTDKKVSSGASILPSGKSIPEIKMIYKNTN